MMISLVSSIISLVLAVQSPASEVDAQLDRVRKQLVDETRTLSDRASIALDEAAGLDRAAQAEATAEGRRGRSKQAVGLLDEFNEAHPGHSFSTPIALQAAVFAWAEGRRDLDAWRVRPGDPDLKKKAIEALDSAIARLDQIEPALSGADPLIAQNARFRVAQALVDRAGAEPEGSPGDRERLRRAFASIEPVPTEPSVAGFARLLRAEIDVRLGHFEAAEREVEAAGKLKFPPPAESLIEIKTGILIGQRRFVDAIKLVDASGLDESSRAILAIRVGLARRKGMGSSGERREIEADLFVRAKSLRSSTKSEARISLNDLARSIDVPDPSADPEAWDVLSEAALGLGSTSRASRLADRGADRARDQNQPEEAARLRFKAGAILYQAGDFSGADGLLVKVRDDPKAGPIRSRAGMLLALSRGRALAIKAPGATRSAYLSALRDQVRSFPEDPASGEARWLLGSVESEDGRAAEAVGLWSSIPSTHPRWLASRLAIATEKQKTLDEARIGYDSTRVREAYRSVSTFLKASSSSSTEPADLIELDLAEVRLELTPGVGRPDLARALCDRLAHQGASDAQRARAKALRVVALAMSQRPAEAETEARAESGRGSTEDILVAARLLDRAATETESDLQRARLGQCLRVLTEGLDRRAESMTPVQAAEARLRTVRGLLLAGQVAVARRALSGQGLDPVDLDLDGLRDLADTLNRLEAYGLVVDVERLRARSLKPGSPPWLESRYGLALALYRDRKSADAQQVIDATAILHPDLGGGRLRERFERLRQRLVQGN